MKPDNNKQKAKKIIQEAKIRNYFHGRFNAKEKTGKPCFEGEIRGLEDINIGYNPNYPLHEVSYQEPFSSALEFIVEHEITHKSDGKGRGCPRNETLDIEEILTPISLRLKENGLPNIPFGNQGHTLYTYFSNLFEDLVVNTIVCDNRGSLGAFLSYDDMGHHTGKFNPLFEAFIKLQGAIFPQKEGLSLMFQYTYKDKKAWEAVKGFLDRTDILKVPRNIRADYLSDHEKWKELSDVFADEFSKLVDPRDLQASYYPIILGNDLSRLNDDEVIGQIAMRAYGRKGSSFEIPPFLEDNKALISVYRQLAKKIKIDVESHSVEVEMPVGYSGTKRFDFSEDPLEKLKYGLSEEGVIEARIGRWPLKVRSRYQTSSGNFPEVRIGLVDCSGSTRTTKIGGKKGKVMNPWAKEVNQWTDTSIYHYELETAFGLLELFKQRGTLRSSNVRLGTFSNKTRMGNNLRDSEEKLLEPSFGGTKFDARAIDSLFKGEGSLVYTLSDGYIGNWGNIKDSFLEGAKRHHYVHFQYGDETQMTHDLRDEGLLVVRGDADKSAQILVDLTQKGVYRKK